MIQMENQYRLAVWKTNDDACSDTPHPL